MLLRRFPLSHAALLILPLCGTSLGFAQAYIFNTASGSWNNFSNWNKFDGTAANDVPNSGVDAIINNGRTVTLGSGVSGSSFQTFVGYDDTAGTVSISGGSLECYDIIVNFGGTLNVSGGTLFSHDDSTPAFSSVHVGNGTLNLTGTGTVQVGAGSAGKLYLAYVSGQTGTLNIGTGGIAGTLNAAEVQGTSGGTVNFNHTNNISFSPKLSGQISVTKQGSGTTTLQGANTYTGGTTISAGTLQLGAANSLPAGGALAFAGGTLATGGFTPGGALGALTLSSSSTIDFGSGTSALAFADSSAVSWSGTLSLLNYTSNVDSLRIGTNGSGLTVAQLGQISFGGIGAQIDSSGFITPAPIPEPSTYAALIGSAALGAVFWRRRKTAASDRLPQV